MDRAPGLDRSFGFEKLAIFDAEAWNTLKRAAYARVHVPANLAIYGSDRYGEALKLARMNLTALKISRIMSF